MSLGTFVMVLVAAMLHAAWNLAMKDSGDRLVAAWAIMGVGGLASVPVLAALGPPPSAALGWLGVSVCIHVGYALALARAYELTDLAVAYPVARGTAPLLVTIGGVTLLGDSIAPLGVVGVVVVSAALMSMMRRGSLAGYRWAVLTGLFIAGYTLSDGAGVRAGDDAIRYIAVLFVLQTLGVERCGAAHAGIRSHGGGGSGTAVAADPGGPWRSDGLPAGAHRFANQPAGPGFGAEGDLHGLRGAGRVPVPG
nr:hypothetical protein [Candidatus Microthrix sp.]